MVRMAPENEAPKPTPPMMPPTQRRESAGGDTGLDHRGSQQYAPGADEGGTTWCQTAQEEAGHGGCRGLDESRGTVQKTTVQTQQVPDDGGREPHAETGQHSSKDFTALDRYLHPDYIQHNPFIPPAKAGLRAFIAELPDATRYEPGAIIAEGDLVMVHGRYSGASDTALLGVDIFRFEDGLVAEHWDVLQDEVAAQDTAAGNPMFTDPQAGSGVR